MSSTRASSAPSAGYCYSVSASIDGEYIMGSPCYNSKRDATEMLKYLQTCDPSKILFEVYSHRPTSRSGTFDSQFLLTDEPPAEVYDPNYVDLSHMSLTKYGSGYLLTPPANDEYFGCPDFMGGTWMPQHRAWFFKSPAEAYSLLEYGVIQMEGVTDEQGHYISDAEFDVLTITDEFVPSTGEAPYAELCDMTLEEFGRGYMLYPESSHPNYGQKYLGDGFWNDKQKGWFFRSRFLNDLLNSGFKLSTGEEEYEDGEIVESDEFVVATGEAPYLELFNLGKSKLMKYGRGYMLQPKQSHKYYGQKYLGDGYWMPSQNGWFFRSRFLRDLVSSGFSV